MIAAAGRPFLPIQVCVTSDGDSVDIGGVRVRGPAPATDHGQVRRATARFLSVWFRCCHVYGRMNLLPDRRRYEGRCPRCGAMVGASIGENGTKQRLFEAT